MGRNTYKRGAKYHGVRVFNGFVAFRKACEIYSTPLRSNLNMALTFVNIIKGSLLRYAGTRHYCGRCIFLTIIRASRLQFRDSWKSVSISKAGSPCEQNCPWMHPMNHFVWDPEQFWSRLVVKDLTFGPLRIDDAITRLHIPHLLANFEAQRRCSDKHLGQNCHRPCPSGLGTTEVTWFFLGVSWSWPILFFRWKIPGAANDWTVKIQKVPICTVQKD